MQNFLYNNNKVQKFPLALPKRNVLKIGMPIGTWACQVEKLTHHLARWHAKLKHWHGVWHVGTFIGTLAHKNEKLARFWHVTLARKPRWHGNTSTRKRRWHVSTLTRRPRWYVGTHGTRFSLPR